MTEVSPCACVWGLNDLEEISTTRRIWGHEVDAGVLALLRMDPAWETDQAMAAFRRLVLGSVTMAQVMHLRAPHPWAYSPWARAVCAYQMVRDDARISQTNLADYFDAGAMEMPSWMPSEITQTLHPNGGGYPNRIEETP